LLTLLVALVGLNSEVETLAQKPAASSMRVCKELLRADYCGFHSKWRSAHGSSAIVSDRFTLEELLSMPFLVVDSYRIVQAETTNDRASVVVEFQSLAQHTQRNGGDWLLTPTPTPVSGQNWNDRFTYEMKIVDGEWQFLHLPPPRLSRITFINVALSVLGAIPGEWICLNSVRAYADRDEATARRLVLDFCEDELSGGELRGTLVKFSKERQATEDQRAPDTGGYWVDLDADPLVIVDHFQVEAVTIGSLAATATVTYQVLGSATGGGGYAGPDIRERKIAPAPAAKVTETLVLRHDGKRWWVVDPPPPHVGWATMVSFYSHQLAEREEGTHRLIATDYTKRLCIQTAKALEAIIAIDKDD
jgi:hypothetical protein